jgi:arylamine N-acetyltransferase
MNNSFRNSASVLAVEALMLVKFRTEPFHNLHLLYGNYLQSVLQGGTCSDKSLSFLSAAKTANFEVALHSGFIGGKEIHRLIRVHIDGRIFFADVGNGWPSLRLYPADREVNYRCFGMGFRTEISGSCVTVFHERHGKETLQLEIEIRGRPESEIRVDIAARFNSGVVYPFSNSIRFSRIVGDQFVFLRGNSLEIYGDKSFEVVDGLNEADSSRIILHNHPVKTAAGSIWLSP